MAIEWTEDRVEELKKLWEQEISTAEIGKILGVTKNSVVGKAHRLGLEKRQSPIKRKEGTTKTTTKKKEVITILNLKRNMCAWSFSDPDKDDFHFCGKEIVPGKPYCLKHCQEAYVKPQKKDK